MVKRATPCRAPLFAPLSFSLSPLSPLSSLLPSVLSLSLSSLFLSPLSFSSLSLSLSSLVLSSLSLPCFASPPIHSFSHFSLQSHRLICEGKKAGSVTKHLGITHMNLHHFSLYTWREMKECVCEREWKRDRECVWKRVRKRMKLKKVTLLTTVYNDQPLNHPSFLIFFSLSLSLAV